LPTVRTVRATASRQWRWALVAVGTAALVSIPAIVDAWPAKASEIDASSLRARIMASADTPYQGYIEGHGGIHLPDLPGAADLSTLISDTSRIRIWYSSPDRWRSDLLYSGGERDRYKTPTGLWVWDSGTHRSTFVNTETQLRLPIPTDITPPELARRALAAAQPSELSPLGGRRVAGHDASGIRIVPREPASTIGAIDLWADPATGLPLRVDVFAKGHDEPTLQTSFLDLQMKAPDANLLSFHPPRRSVARDDGDALDLVQAIELYSDSKLPATLAGLPRRTEKPGAAATYGRGFGVVGVLALPEQFVTDTLRALPATKRPWGHTAAVVSTALVNGMIFALDGTAYIVGGPVSVKELDRVAAAIAAGGSS
jgi:hypothetical protein